MRFRRPITFGVVPLLVALTLLAGGRRMPTGPDGGYLEPTGGGDPPVNLHVGVFNIHGCKGTDGRRDARRVAECLDRLQIVGLNEVRGLVWGDPRDQAEQLARLGGFQHHLFAPAETRLFGIRRFGNGLLSQIPVVAWQRIPLPRRHGRSCRNMLLVELRFGPENVAVLVAHVTRSNDAERKLQLESVLDLFASLEPPAILLADLNTPPGDPRIQRFLAESGSVDAITSGGADRAEHRVDWILVRGLECLSASRVESGVSDHPLFTARLAWREDASRAAGGRRGTDRCTSLAGIAGKKSGDWQPIRDGPPCPGTGRMQPCAGNPPPTRRPRPVRSPSRSGSWCCLVVGWSPPWRRPAC
jgi:endonuclease/exonuclease/phosphatase family metal-dependent hydrolase